MCAKFDGDVKDLKCFKSLGDVAFVGGIAYDIQNIFILFRAFCQHRGRQYANHPTCNPSSDQDKYTLSCPWFA